MSAGILPGQLILFGFHDARYRWLLRSRTAKSLGNVQSVDRRGGGQSHGFFQLSVILVVVRIDVWRADGGCWAVLIAPVACQHHYVPCLRESEEDSRIRIHIPFTLYKVQ